MALGKEKKSQKAVTQSCFNCSIFSNTVQRFPSSIQIADTVFQSLNAIIVGFESLSQQCKNPIANNTRVVINKAQAEALEVKRKYINDTLKKTLPYFQPFKKGCVF